MRPCGLLRFLVVGGLLTACSGDPTLDLAVHHPEGYLVTQTVVTVYFGGDINCAQLEYGDRTDAELAAITVDEVDVTGGGKIEVSRLGGKSLVARGFDAQHRFVTAGCKDLGEIAGATKVEIATQPTAVVAIEPAQPDRPFSERTLLVTMSDTNGAALDGNVSWQLTGPAGAPGQPPSNGLMTAAGEVKIHVNDLGTPGPEGLRIRAPWATSPLPLVSAFDLSHATTLALAGTSATDLHPSCDVRRHAGKLATLVCLSQAVNLAGHRDAVEIAWQTDHYVATPIALPAQVNNQFAVFVDHDTSAHDGSADEPAYVISNDQPKTVNWYKLGDPGTGKSMAIDNNVQSVIYVPSCAAGTMSAAVGLTTGATIGAASLLEKEAFYLPNGTQVTPAVVGEVFAGGCIGDVDKQEHQAVVITGMGGDPVLFLVGQGMQAQTQVTTSRLSGSGFVAVATGGTIEQRFAGTRLQATGTVVYESVLAPDAKSYKLVERTELDAAAPPTKIVGGKLDRDGDTDLMWDMTAARRRLFQVSLAAQVGGAPLTAMTSGPAGTDPMIEVDFVTGDLTGDGIDEVVLFTPATVTIYTP